MALKRYTVPFAASAIAFAGQAGWTQVQQQAPSATDASAPTPAQSGTPADLPMGTVSTTSTAAQTADQPAGLADIIVTAQRRSENLQNVPISVSAVTAAAIARSGATDLQSIRLLVPGYTLQITNGVARPYLRGIGTTAAGPGLEIPIATYLDGVYIAAPTGGVLSLNNIAQVEVLKGPQGTLFGRNATGGLINVITKDPTSRFQGSINLSYADYNTLSGNLYVTGGIANGVAADIAVTASTQFQGYGRNLTNGSDTYRTKHDYAVRSKWLLTPAPNTRITITGDYANFSTNANAYRTVPGSRLYPGGPLATYPGDYDNYSDIADNYLRSHLGGVSAKLEQKVGSLSLTDIVAYRYDVSLTHFDSDYTPLRSQTIDQNVRDHQFSNEFQIASPRKGLLTWVAGLYYFSSDSKAVPFDVTVFSAQPLVVETIGEQHARAYAAFGQATFEILHDTNLTGGFRYSWEDRSVNASLRYLLYPSRVAAGAPYPAYQTSTGKISFKKPTFRVAVDHRFSPEVLAYASFNTGFKSGGFNALSLNSAPFRPETLKAYEAGIKTDLLDRHLRVNGAFFYYDYKDVQARQTQATAVAIINAAAARIYGLDLDADAVLNSRLEITAGIELLHDRFTSFPNAPTGIVGGGRPLIAGNASGHRLPFASDLSANASVNYTLPLLGGSVRLNSTALYNSGWYAEPDNIIKQGSFVQLNSSATWTNASNRYSLMLWAKNMTSALIQQHALTSAAGFEGITYQPPATYGVTVGAKF